MGGQGGQLPIQLLADQLTLSPEGVDCAPPTLLLAHPAFGSFQRHSLKYGSFIQIYFAKKKFGGENRNYIDLFDWI